MNARLISVSRGSSTLMAASLVVGVLATASGSGGISHAKESRPNIAMSQMPAFCRGEAAAKFSLSPRDISTLPVERTGSNYRVYGQSPSQGDKALFFYCEFNQHREFDKVIMTSDKRVSEPAVPAGDVVSVTEMPKFCKGKAAEAFEVKLGRVTTNKALRESDGRYRVFGQYITPANDVQVFHCKFSPNGKFLSVKEDNR